MVPVRVRAMAAGALVLPAGRGDAGATFVRTTRAALGGGFILAPGRAEAGTGALAARFVLPTTRGAAALVAAGLPALSDAGPQPVNVKASTPTPIRSLPARRATRARSGDAPTE